MLIEKFFRRLYVWHIMFLERSRNYFLYKNKKIKRIQYELKKMYLKSTEDFGREEFYQSYPYLFYGQRPTLSRIKIYGLDKFLTKDKKILDIGGNVGFFSLYISQFVKEIDIVEYNSKLTKISEKLKNYLKIENVNIINEDFRKFKTDKKYDIIFSFAIHRWINTTPKKYFKLIDEKTKKNTLIFLESHNIKTQNDKLFNQLTSYFIKNNYHVVKEDFIENKFIRKFIVFKKNNK